MSNMTRTLEPELMTDDDQARAYAEADFEAPNSNFVRLFQETFAGRSINGAFLDLGCGTADVTMRLARAYPNSQIYAIDGSAAMLKYAQEALSQNSEVMKRITLIQGYIPEASIPQQPYGAIVSNSLLHHLPDPQALWQTIKLYGQPGTLVFVADLFRPANQDEARRIVETYSANEPEVLKRDFYNSLLAAFTVEEAQSQLQQAGLSNFQARAISDRHLLIWGEMR
jgi:ubiquinone/menaquinone biosynthesis C-methylase UbiE